MAVISSTAIRNRAAAFSLVTLQTMPCGCVAGVYRAQPTIVEVDVVEAKGPHCRFYRHRTGEVMRLGVSDLTSEEGSEPRV
jgi:hypothetical protein